MGSPYAFISYSSSDKSTAFRVCNRLEADGLACWIAPRDVAAGVQYPTAILEAVKGASAVVLLTSAASLASPHVMRELVLAVDHGVPILPLRIEAVEAAGPFRYLIAGQQILDALPPPIDDHLDRVVAAARSMLATDKPGVIRVEDMPEGVTFEVVGPGLVRPLAPSSIDVPPNRHTARPDAFVGRTVGEYDIRDYLGSGGSAQVFSAWDRRRRRLCCVKIYYPTPKLHAAWRGRTVFAALSALRHPSVVEALDIGTLDWSGWPTHFAVSELIHGVPLDVWLKISGAGASDIARRCRIAASLVEAVTAAHSCRYLDEVGIEQTGLLHGDIKPQNIMVRQDDSPVLLDFLDFRLVDRPAQDSGEARDEPATSTTLYGTRGHMAPEQEHQGVLTRKSDFFGLGLVIGCLFLGEFNTVNRDQKLAAAEAGRIPGWIIDAVSSLTLPEADKRPRDLAPIGERFRAAARGGWRERLAAGLAGKGWKW